MNWLWVVAGVVIAVAVARYLIGGSTPTARIPEPAGRIKGKGYFEFDVVGESHYQDALERLAGGRSRSGAEVQKKAMLVPENDNPHDSQAVGVFIEESRVGHLSRRDARSWRKMLKEEKIEDQAIECDALIVGGWDRGDGDRGHFGVKLDIG